MAERTGRTGPREGRDSREGRDGRRPRGTLERGRSLERADRSLGASDFDASPYDGLPRRTRARKTILPGGASPPPLPPAKGRRLSRAERRAIQERRKQAAALPPRPAPVPSAPVVAAAAPSGRLMRPRKAVPAARRRGLTVGGLVIVVLTLVAFGTGRFFGAGQALPTPTRTAPVVALGSPPPAVVVAASPLASPSPRATREPQPPVFNAHDGRKVVCLDPGHGGADTGYKRADDGTAPAMMEKDVNLRFAWDLDSRLQSDGIHVVMTRNDDVAVNRFGADVNGDGQTGPLGSTAGDLDELQARINICNRANADLIVSMHINGFPDSSARGYEVWYTGSRPFQDQSRYFARLIDDELGKQMDKAGYDPPNRGVNDDVSANVQRDPDVFTAKHYVIIGPEIVDGGKVLIKPTLMPGAIVESAFISNDQDAAFLASQQGEDAIVTAYEVAIQQYFEKYPG